VPCSCCTVMSPPNSCRPPTMGNGTRVHPLSKPSSKQGGPSKVEDARVVLGDTWLAGWMDAPGSNTGSRRWHHECTVGLSSPSRSRPSTSGCARSRWSRPSQGAETLALGPPAGAATTAAVHFELPETPLPETPMAASPRDSRGRKADRQAGKRRAPARIASGNAVQHVPARRTSPFPLGSSSRKLPPSFPDTLPLAS
jgi:hypothetical protein